MAFRLLKQIMDQGFSRLKEKYTTNPPRQPGGVSKGYNRCRTKIDPPPHIMIMKV